MAKLHENMSYFLGCMNQSLARGLRSESCLLCDRHAHSLCAGAGSHLHRERGPLSRTGLPRQSGEPGREWMLTLRPTEEGRVPWQESGRPLRGAVDGGPQAGLAQLSYMDPIRVRP